MGLIERAMALLPQPRPAWGSDMVRLSLPDETLPAFINRLTATNNAPAYRLPSVRQSMGVPAIQRAVSLIAGTTGMLTMQAYRDRALMDEPPRLVSRPDPFNTPQQFYGTTAAQMAKYGEFVWWIATRDSDGIASSLVPVPLVELKVEENKSNRLLPRYTWGTKSGTRYSPANPDGVFVHVKYPLAEPFDLRGEGPLQICKAATSVTVEAQNWAANFFAEGGHPSVIVKKAGLLGTEADDDGLYEADRLRSQWVDRAHNTARVIDDNIESVDYKEPSIAGAQMLEARQHQNGDASRMFGIAGSLLEYQQPGSSLTYQNLEGEFTKFVRTCLQPLYLEPIEQAMSDLLTRSTAARFNVDGFLRADIKTRYEVHGIAIDKGIYDPLYARQVEGIDPGDAEFQPTPFAPPSAVPTTIPRMASTNVRCPKCNKLVARALGPGSSLDCPRCKTTVLSDGVKTERQPDIHVNVNMPEGMVRIDSPVTVHPPDIHIAPSQVDIAPTIVGEDQMSRFDDGMTLLHKAIEARERAIEEKLTEAARPKRLKVERDKTGRIVSGTLEIAEAG